MTTKKSLNNARIEKGGKMATITVDMGKINVKDPYVSDKGNASIMERIPNLEFNMDIDGVTLPITCKVSMYVKKKDWNQYVEQRDGIKEGKKQGTNMPELDAELFQQFLQFQEFMKSQKK